MMNAMVVIAMEAMAAAVVVAMGGGMAMDKQSSLAHAYTGRFLFAQGYRCNPRCVATMLHSYATLCSYAT
jgi:hypothetical protein